MGCVLNPMQRICWIFQPFCVVRQTELTGEKSPSRRFFRTSALRRRQKAWFLPPATARSYARAFDGGIVVGPLSEGPRRVSNRPAYGGCVTVARPAPLREVRRRTLRSPATARGARYGSLWLVNVL
jgi:hypothetical protein